MGVPAYSAGRNTACVDQEVYTTNESATLGGPQSEARLHRMGGLNEKGRPPFGSRLKE